MLTHWSYVFLALTHRYEIRVLQCTLNISRSFLCKWLTKDAPQLAHEGEIWDVLSVFMRSRHGQYSAYVVLLQYHLLLNHYIDGLVEERRNSSALAMELCLSCTNPLIYQEYMYFVRIILCSTVITKPVSVAGKRQWCVWIRIFLRLEKNSRYGLGQNYEICLVSVECWFSSLTFLSGSHP